MNIRQPPLALLLTLAFALSQVKDATGDSVMDKDYAGEGRFVFHTHEAGEHSVCIGKRHAVQTTTCRLVRIHKRHAATHHAHTRFTACIESTQAFNSTWTESWTLLKGTFRNSVRPLTLSSHSSCHDRHQRNAVVLGWEAGPCPPRYQDR